MPSPPIALDATYSLGRNLTGVGVYCHEMVHGLAAEHPEQHFLACYRSQRLLDSFRERLPRNCGRRLLAESMLPRGAALFHGLNQRMPAFRFRRACVTVHDLFVLTGEYSSPEFRRRFAEQARAAVDRSDLVLCVSRFTAHAVQNLLRVEPERIRVVHHGVRTASLSRVREPMILHLGAIQKRKNLLRLVTAFEQVAAYGAPGQEWQLVLAGSDGFGSEEVHARIAASPARARIHTTGYLPNEEVAELYARASLFVFPSLDEGFGMPVLEAMSHGTPVIASRRSALPEVCGNAALLVDPFRQDELADALRRLMHDPTLRAKYSVLGKEQASRFSWPKAVRETWQVYRELIS